MDGKGKICWLVDTKGWAFENRAKAISSLITEYEHEIVVFRPWMDLDKFDIIVCEFLPWMEFLDVAYHRIILGLRSFRALEMYNANT